MADPSLEKRRSGETGSAAMRSANQASCCYSQSWTETAERLPISPSRFAFSLLPAADRLVSLWGIGFRENRKSALARKARKGETQVDAQRR